MYIIKKSRAIFTENVVLYAVFYTNLFQLLKENDVNIPLVNNSPCIATVTLSAAPSDGRYVNKFYVLTLIAP